MKRRSRVESTFALIALTLLATACGGSSKLDDLKAQMVDVFTTQRGVELVDIECEDGAAVEPNASFLCTSSVTDGEGRLRVQVSIDADGAARFEQMDAIVILGQIEADVAADLTFGLGTDIAVSCRDDQATVYRVEPVNATFRCTAVAVGSGTATRDVEITVSGLDHPHVAAVVGLIRTPAHSMQTP